MPERVTAAIRWVKTQEKRALTAALVSLLLLLGVVVGFVYGGAWLDINDQADVEALLGKVRSTPWAPVVVLAVYSVVGLTGFPQFMLMAAAVVIFGPTIGFLYAWLGTVFSAHVGFGVGHFMAGKVMRKYAGARINRVSQRIGDHGIVASILVRVVPTAPFAVVNMMAGASHIAFGQYFIGTLLGVMPKAALVAYIGASLSDFIEKGDPKALFLLGLVLLLWVGVGIWVQRLVRRLRLESEAQFARPAQSVPPSPCEAPCEAEGPVAVSSPLADPDATTAKTDAQASEPA